MNSLRLETNQSFPVIKGPDGPGVVSPAPAALGAIFPFYPLSHQPKSLQLDDLTIFGLEHFDGEQSVPSHTSQIPTTRTLRCLYSRLSHTNPIML